MIECHPLLRPIVNLAKPVVHAVKTVHPKIIGVRHHVFHHVHRALNAATPPQAVLTVCQRVAGPIVAGGLLLLPPASAVPPAGGVGGFPGAIVPEYGAPAFGPGYASGGPFGYAPGGGGGGYGPAALGLGGILGPTSIAPSISQITSPGTSVPTTPTIVTQNVPPDGSPTVPGITQPGTPSPPPDGSPTPPVTPPSVVPPTTPTPPVTPPATTPGDSTPPVNTPEPASIAVLAGAFALAVFSRAIWTRRTRRG